VSAGNLAPAGAPAERAAIYGRISDDQAGDEHGVTNQIGQGEKLAEARGLQVAARYSDNSISASNGDLRPGYEAMMLAAARREFDTLICWQTSRLWRNRVERARAIEVLCKAGISVVAVKGPSLDMSTAYGRMMAGLIGEFDTAETAVKSERQKMAAEAAARAGKRWTGCPVPFGYQADHVTADPAEKDAVEDACRSLLAGGTLSGVCRDWSARGLRPHQAPFGPLLKNPWTRVSVSTILRNPRIAGLSVYDGIEVGTGQWEPLVTEPVYRAVAALLGDPSRRRAPGVRSTLGGLARCRCGNHVTASANCRGSSIYRCNPSTRNGRPGPHVTTRSAPVDDAIGELVKERLRKPDAIDLLAPKARADTVRLADEAQAIRARRAQLVPDQTLGLITRADMLAGLAAADRRLAEIGEQLAEAGRESVLAPLLAAERIEDEWDRTPADRRRAVIDSLMDVVLWPAGRGARELDADRVIHVGWRER
jgi:site-specific DNA recombinase